MMGENYLGMSEREILVMVATKLEYVEKGIENTNNNIEKNVEALRITINDCNRDHCKREDEQEKKTQGIFEKVEKLENRQYYLGGAIGVIGIFLGAMKDNIISLFTGK